jgi:hypothetical protein
MTGSTGTPSTGTKPTDVVARSATSRPDRAAASTTETARPSAGNQELRGIRTAESFVRENPTASLLAALATGLVLGALLGRSGRGHEGPRRMPDYDDEGAYQRDYYYD